VRLRWVAPIEKLTADEALARLLLDDPLIGTRRVRLGFLRSLHVQPDADESYDLPCPLLLVHPGRDAWTPFSLSLPVFDAVRSPKRCVVLDNGSHAPLEQPAYTELCSAVAGFLEQEMTRAAAQLAAPSARTTELPVGHIESGPFTG
jgi:pimeloyl-ACP methyl ester carboxylesterase